MRPPVTAVATPKKDRIGLDAHRTFERRTRVISGWAMSDA